MATETAADPGPSPASSRNAPWHGLTADEVTAQLGADPSAGLGAGEVEKRLAQYGPNKLAEAPKEPGWHAFLRQYRDLMLIPEAAWLFDHVQLGTPVLII